MNLNVAPYRKFIVAVGAVVAEIVAVSVDGSIDANEGVAIVLSLLAALGVYGVANEPTEA